MANRRSLFRRICLPFFPVAVLAVFSGCPAAKPAGQPGTYLFCSWNVENFYDDDDDPKIDDKMEDWFGRNPDKFRHKVDRLAEALLMMNDGRGPDIMALCEVENARCMNCLKDALNERLSKEGKADLKYEHVLFLGDKTGRHFAPGIMTRLPVEGDRTHHFAKRPNGRNVEGHIHVNGHALIILASHWTSRVERMGGKGGEEHANAARRMSYAKDCYGRFRAILTENPDADVIVCGDFNDDFDDPSLQYGLHVSNNLDEVRNAMPEFRLLDLVTLLPTDGGVKGTIYGKRKWSTFDHICISRGLLDDRGWSCDVTSAAIFAPKQLRYPGRHGNGQPFRFGDAHTQERGFSDHFPLTVRLRVE